MLSRMVAARDENAVCTESVLAPAFATRTQPSVSVSCESMDRRLRCEVISEVGRLEEISSEWSRIWKSDSRAEIFQTPEWATAWWRSFGQGATLCSLVVFAGDEIVGIVPLVNRGGVIQFLGTPEADYADIICEEKWAPEVLAAAFKTLRESVTGWTECVLQHLAQHSRVVRHYGSVPRQLLSSLHCVPAERYQTVVFREKRDAVFGSLLGKNHTRRRRNKLQKAGEVRFRHLENAQEAEAYLDDFFRHHVRRHAVIGRRSAYAVPEARQFIKTLIRQLGPAVRFGVLELDGRPLAWHLGFQVNGKFLLYQHTFDLDASDYTPGELLLWNLFEYAKDNIAREFDFGKGDEPYKDRFANYSRQTFSLFVEPQHLAGRVRGIGRTAQRHVQPSLQRMKQSVKSRRAILRAFRSARMWLIGNAARFRQASSNGVLPQYGLDLMRDLLRECIWSRRSITVFEAEEFRDPNAVSLVGAEGFSDLEVHQAGFGDLVDLAWEHPEIVLLSDLPRCRERLKRGDQVYIVRQKSRIVILGWLTKGNVPAASLEQGDNPGADSQAMVMDECWSASDDVSACYRPLLRLLAHQAESKRADLLIHCGANQPGLRSELKRMGFIPRFRIIRYKLFHRFRRDSVLLPTKDSDALSQVA